MINVINEAARLGMTLFGIYGQVAAAWAGHEFNRFDHAIALFARQETPDA